MRVKNPTAYLKILENNPNGADLLELDEMISDTVAFLNNPKVHPTMKIALAGEKNKLNQCHEDLSHGRQNPFWEGQKVKAQKAIDEENEMALALEAFDNAD